MTERRRNKLTKAIREEIVRLYREGEPVKVIAERFGCSLTYPGMVARAHGVKGRRNWVVRSALAS